MDLKEIKELAARSCSLQRGGLKPGQIIVAAPIKYHREINAASFQRGAARNGLVG
jgi:hypothetical protein